MKLIIFFCIFSFHGRALSFPSSETIDRQVWFWEQIFLSFHNKQIVIHDAENPEIIIDIVDLPKMAFKTKQDEDNWIISLQDRYQLGVKNFVKLGDRAYFLGSIERRLFFVYKEKKGVLKAGKVNVRAQRGLSDIFEIAIQRSSPYLSKMEAIFEDNGIPKELTRIAFVESMFNVEARSKVGASGIWQFMPNTARRFMLINRLIDERNSPLKATEGAAKLLKINFSELGSWPLAITAYNHGLFGIKRAVQANKSRSLSNLIENYKSRSFGFASRNFYGEFLAARRAYGIKTKTMKRYRKKVDVQKIVLNRPISPASIVGKTLLTKTELQSLNLCLSKAIFTSAYHRPLPKNYSFWVPSKKYQKIRSQLAKL